MKFVTFRTKTGAQRAGWLHSTGVVDMKMVGKGLFPETMLEFLEQSETLLELAQQTIVDISVVFPFHEVQLLAPLPVPVSFRDFYAFEEHVKTARRNRGLEVVPEWYEIPVFYFSNHRAIVGPNEEVRRPQKSTRLDYELEIACVIGKQGRNIKASEATDYIFGYCILNDWSARDIQMQEVKVGLGPAKGKDFATSIGPYLVTKDELERYRTHDRYDLEMKATVNGICLSKGNFKDIYYSFAQMIERASDDVTLYPGDIIGSGTVGSGCILELGTDAHRWLQPGDVVELEVTGLGRLRNRIT